MVTKSDEFIAEVMTHDHLRQFKVRAIDMTLKKQSVSTFQNNLNFSTNDLLIVRTADKDLGDLAGVVIKIDKDYIKLLLSSGERVNVKNAEVISKITKKQVCCNYSNFHPINKGDYVRINEGMHKGVVGPVKHI